MHLFVSSSSSLSSPLIVIIATYGMMTELCARVVMMRRYLRMFFSLRLLLKNHRIFLQHMRMCVCVLSSPDDARMVWDAMDECCSRFSEWNFFLEMC